MNNPLKSDGSLGLALLLARLPLGATVALAGYRAFRPGSAADQVITRVPSFLPDGTAAGVYQVAMPYVATALGAFLLAGFLTRLSGFLSALLLINLGLLFGVGGFVDTRPEMASKLVQAPAIYTTFALIALLAGPGKFSVDGLLFGGRSAGPRDRY